MIAQRDYSRYHFEGQNPDEKILLVLHRHWFDVVSQFLLIFFMLLFFFVTLIGVPLFAPALSEGPAQNLFYFLENLFFMIIWVVSFVIWIDYYFDIWVVTDRRIVNIEQKGLFVREISELHLEKIQDITVDIRGMIPTFLNFGDLLVQTAGKEEKFLFHFIPQPEDVKDLIMSLQKQFEHQEENEFSDMLSKKIRHEDKL